MQTLMQAITQVAMWGMRTVVKAMTEVADLVEGSTRNAAIFAGPKVGRPHLKRPKFN